MLNDNNAKVLSHAQQSFKSIILNQNLAQLIEQNLSMIVQALNTNISSTNTAAKDQGEVLFNILEGAADPNLLLPPIVAQINLANNRSKHLLIERLSSKTHNHLIENKIPLTLFRFFICYRSHRASGQGKPDIEIRVTYFLTIKQDSKRSGRQRTP